MKLIKNARMRNKKLALDMLWAYTLEGYYVTMRQSDTDIVIEAWELIK